MEEGALKIVRPGADVAVLTLFLLLTTPACMSQPREPLRFGINAWPPFELLYLAQQKGFLRDEGVEIDLVDFSSYTGILRSYHQGNIDGFLATLNEVMIAENFQDLPAVVLVADYSFGGDALIARDGVASLAGLKGRRLAYEESALGSYLLERAFEIGGLSPGEVKLENHVPEDGIQAFVSGRVDALLTYEPDVTRLVKEQGARVVFSSREIPGEVVDVLALRRSLLPKRGAELQAVLRAWFRAADYLRDHPDEAATLMAARQGVSPAEFLTSLRGAHIPDRRENVEMLGTPETPGSLHRVATRLGAFLLSHKLANDVASPAEIFHPELLGPL